MRYLAFVLMLPLMASCAKGGQLGSIVKSFMPTVRFDRVAVKKLDFNGVNTSIQFKVHNPNPIGVHLASWSWNVALDGTQAISGNDARGLDLAANGTSTLRIPVHLVFKDVAKLVTDLRTKSEVPFRLQGRIGLRTPLGVANLPLQARGTLPVPQVPKIKMTGLQFDGMNLTSVNLTLRMSLSHKFAKTMAINALTYGISLDGGALIQGKIPSVPSVAPGESVELRLPIQLNILDAGSTLVQHLTQKSPVKVGVNLGMNVGTPWGPIPLKWSGDDLLSAVRK